MTGKQDLARAIKGPSFVVGAWELVCRILDVISMAGFSHHKIHRRLRWMPNWRIDDAPLVYLDLETTGLHPDRGHEITEIAILDRGGIRLHSEIEGEAEERLALQEASSNIEGLIVVGHNITFDLRFIAERSRRLDLAIPSVGFIDTLGLARRYLEDLDEELTLEFVARALDLERPDELHRAVPDAQLARDVFESLVEREKLETLGDVRVRRFQLHGD